MTANREQELAGFRPQTASEFLQRSIEAKPPIVQDLLHKRDLVALGARRRHGKTGFLIDLAVSLAEGEPDFLGYAIPKAAKTLLILIEDDPRELQERLAKLLTAGSEAARNIELVTREDFLAYSVQIDVSNSEFQHIVRKWAASFKPDVIVLDNLSFLIGAGFADPERIHVYHGFVYGLASAFNAAIVTAAHPRKNSGDTKTGKVTMSKDPEAFFESIMGSSQFINSTGSLWGLERDRASGTTTFVGGRQRGDGHEGTITIELNPDNGRLQLVSNLSGLLAEMTKTPQRRAAWEALPEYPTTFSYTEATKGFLKNAFRSSSSSAEWLRSLRAHGLIVDGADGKLMKAPALVGSRALAEGDELEELLADFPMLKLVKREAA